MTMPTSLLGALIDGHRPTDTGNADRFLALADGRARWVAAWNTWLIYQDGCWVADHNDALVVEFAKQVPREMFRRAAEATGEGRDDLWKWAKRTESAAAIRSMLTLSRGAPGVRTNHEDLDADPYLLNVTNGTINLRTGTLQPHNPDDLLTLQAPVNYDEDAWPTLWARCVDQWQPDPAIRDFLQRAVGSGLTGRPVEALIVNIGKGGNGKSKFFHAVAGVLGPYSTVPHKSLLVRDRHEQHPTVLASLFRARLIVAPETKKGDRLDEESVKNLTGGDRLRARRMREDEWSFDPTWTAFLHTNERPRISGTDEGIWRRLRLIEWPVTIPADQRDPELARKLEAEASGILNWLIDGCVEYLTKGLAEPEQVLAATEQYRHEEDHVGRFIAECCVTDDTRSVPAGTLRTAYEQWCSDSGETVRTAKSIGAELEKRGYDKARVGAANTRVWIGIDLITTPGDDF